MFTKSYQITDPVLLKEISINMADGFYEDPVWNWVFMKHSSQKRQENLQWMIRKILSICIRDGIVYSTLSEITGGAAWLSPGQEISFLKMVRSGLIYLPFKFGISATVKILKIVFIAQRFRKQNHLMQTYYLSQLAISRKYQGKGLGRLLLEPVLIKCDAEKCVAYLESSNKENLSFYEKMGFQILQSTSLDQAGPDLYFLVRKPGNV